MSYEKYIVKKDVDLLSGKKEALFNQKIIYVVPLYCGYGVSSFNPLLPDVVMIDWQIRLLRYLVDNGYPVHVKQHPESKTRMDGYFFEELGVYDLDGRFEDVVDPRDVVIFDWHLTTTFGYALKNGNPMLLIDFGLLNLRRREKNYLSRRVGIVQGYFDERNRCQVNWEEMASRLEECPTLDSVEFQSIVLGES